MRQGTTPKLTFTLPFEAATIAWCEVYFSQNEQLLVEKNYDDCQFADNQMEVRLTQEETLLFSTEDKLEIQIRFGFHDGTVDATDIIKAKVKEILDKEVMEWQ